MRNKNLEKNQMKIAYKICCIFLLCILSIKLNAQINVRIENDDNLFWQPNIELSYSDFKSKSNEDCEKFNEKYGWEMSGTIELKGIVDVPKSHLSKRIRKRKGDDKSYIAPVFCKNCSCKLSENSSELEVHKLLFDVAEMCSRALRRELSETKAKMEINNVNTMFFTTAKNKWDERMRKIWGTILQDILIENKKGAYLEWRNLINELMEKNEEFATKPNEIKRLMSEMPIEEGYVEADRIVGDLDN
ncbi:hypothetical protein [Nonlabens agnitus]|uniref:Uncharacterized protein n=1 Tax=Nonlabens agnitus TaxID=870484 RepID=A0A2S9WUJ2_9FLAO|nr:hypothetical protein [Nonlabens agnitus]PRP67143.1 hypothetical protein BST86_08555 [Nonlabens agnitus]